MTRPPMRPLGAVLLGIVAALFAAFFLWPLLESVMGAFFDPRGELTFAYIAAVFKNPIYLEGFLNSLKIAVLSTLLAAAVGIPLAIVSERYDFPGRRLMVAFVPLPLIVPPFVGAIGIQQLLGQRGVLNAVLAFFGMAEPIDFLREGRLMAVVVLTALHLYPILFFNLSAALANQDPEVERAAELLGARGLRKLFRVTLPLAAPSLFASLTLIFIWGLTELGVPLMCDYGRVTSVQIFSGLKNIGQNPFVYALVTVTLVLTLGLYGLSRVFLRKAHALTVSKGLTARTRKPLAGPAALLTSLLGLALVVLAALPNLAVILVSLSRDWYGTVLPTGFTVDHYRAALSHGMVVPAIANSLRYVALSTAFDVVLGFAIAWIVVRRGGTLGKLLDALCMLPLAVPGLVLAFGYVAVTREGRPLAFLDPADDPTILLVIAYGMRRLPFVVRSCVAGLSETSRTLEEAARSLGAPPARTLLRVTLPLTLPHLFAGAVFAFALSMLEVSDSLILAQKQLHYPITKAIYELYQLLGDGRLLAAALGVWAMLFLGASVALARRLLGSRSGRMFGM